MLGSWMCSLMPPLINMSHHRIIWLSEYQVPIHWQIYVLPLPMHLRFSIIVMFLQKKTWLCNIFYAMLFWWQWIIIGVFLDSIALSDLLLKKMTQALWENISQNSVLPKNVMFCQFCPPKLVKKEVVGVRLIIDTKKENN